MKYGGINTAADIDEIAEATVYVKPPVVYPKWVTVLAAIFAIIRIIPIVLLFMVAWGGLSLAVLAISN